MKSGLDKKVGSEVQEAQPILTAKEECEISQDKKLCANVIFVVFNWEI